MRKSELSPMEKRELSSLGKGIARLRKKRGMSQLSLALRSGLSKSYLCDLESGRRNPCFLTLTKIASTLGVEVSDLFAESQGDSELI